MKIQQLCFILLIAIAFSQLQNDTFSTDSHNTPKSNYHTHQSSTTRVPKIKKTSFVFSKEIISLIVALLIAVLITFFYVKNMYRISKIGEMRDKAVKGEIEIFQKNALQNPCIFEKQEEMNLVQKIRKSPFVMEVFFDEENEKSQMKVTNLLKIKQNIYKAQLTGKGNYGNFDLFGLVSFEGKALKIQLRKMYHRKAKKLMAHTEGQKMMINIIDSGQVVFYEAKMNEESDIFKGNWRSIKKFDNERVYEGQWSLKIINKN